MAAPRTPFGACGSAIPRAYRTLVLLTCTIVAMSLFGSGKDLPGITGTLRECPAHLRKLSAGDIALVDVSDMTRTFASRLAEASPAAVVNVSSFVSGSVPHFGPQMLLDEGIVLIEGVGAEIRSVVKSGKKVRIDGDGVYVGDRLVARGTRVTPDIAEENFRTAQASLVDRMEAYFGNAIEFIHSEAPLLVDGVGVPDPGIDIEDRKVLTVGPCDDLPQELKKLKNFIREYDPVLIGVDRGADVLTDSGYKPDLIVGDPSEISADALRSGARVVMPADPDGHAPGLERIQDLGIGAITFPALSKESTELAILLADFHGASMIVHLGTPVDLQTVFAGTTEQPSALLTRFKAGGKLVDARAVSDLYVMQDTSAVAWVWALFGLIVLAAVTVLIAGFSGDGTFGENLVTTWNNVALTVQSWFK